MTLKSRLAQIGHRDGPLQEPALVVQDEVFGRHDKVLRVEPLCDLNSDAKALKSSARRASIGRTSKTSVRIVIRTMFSIRQGGGKSQGGLLQFVK
jgi:hypothetical protein